MKRITLLMLVFSSHFTLCAQENNYKPNQLIVKFNSLATLLNVQERSNVLLTGWKEVDLLNEKYGCSRADELFPKCEKCTYSEEMAHVYLLHFSKEVDISRLIIEYMATGKLAYAEPNYLAYAYGVNGQAATPNDQYFASRQWSMRNSGTFPDYKKPSKAGADVSATLAWDITTGDTNTVVAIIDTGTKLDHPEFSGRIWINKAEIPGNNIDDDQNGYIDDVRGWDFTNKDNDPTDDNGHGSNVAGIIGATGNNGIGYAGMDWKCKLMILKVLNASGKGDNAGIASAITYAANNGAKVINLSLGSTSFLNAMQSAITNAFNKNVLSLAASGNNNTSIVDYPSGYANCMAVGSTSPDDTRSVPFGNNSTGGSNYGQHLSVCAPGNMIYGIHYSSNTDYSWWYGGTSQATPHVAGLASLLLSKNPSLTAAQLRSIIEKTAEDKVGSSSEDVTGWDQYYGWGRINAHKALTYLVTSMNELNFKNNEVVIFPNPATGIFSVLISEKQVNGDSQLFIYDVSGRTIYRKSYHEGESMEVNAALFPIGTYFIKVINNAAETYHSKFVKN